MIKRVLRLVREAYAQYVSLDPLIAMNSGTVNLILGLS